MDIQDIKFNETRVHAGTGTTEYTVTQGPDKDGFVVLLQQTGPSKGKYYLHALRKLTPVPVPYPTGYQLVGQKSIGPMRSTARRLVYPSHSTPRAVKIHHEDGSTTLVPWVEWVRYGRSLSIAKDDEQQTARVKATLEDEEMEAEDDYDD